MEAGRRALRQICRRAPARLTGFWSVAGPSRGLLRAGAHRQPHEMFFERSRNGTQLAEVPSAMHAVPRSLFADSGVAPRDEERVPDIAGDGMLDRSHLRQTMQHLFAFGAG